ncbi:MAG: response regulator transcription factor [Phycisphaerales bacterium]
MNNYKVLIADDDVPFTTAVSVRLRSEGYDVVVAQDGYMALDTAVKQKPDLLILDINMPAGNGFSVHERLRQHAHMSTVPLIYVTGERNEWLRDSSLEHGAFGFLRKPFDSEELLTLVRQALGQEAIEIP